MRNLLGKLNFAIMRNIIRKCISLLSKAGVIFRPVKAFIKKHNEILNPIFVLTAICLIIAAALSLTNSLTADRIEQMNAQNKKAEMAALIPAEKYEEKVILWEVADPHFSLSEAKNGEEISGYIITSSAKGYGGELVIMTAFNPDKSVKAISVLNADNETPGLGQKVTTPEFSSQFIGTTTKMEVVKTSADNAAGEIKALTGATISSKGAVNAVNSAREYLEAYLNLRRFENEKTDTVAEATTDNNGGGVDEK